MDGYELEQIREQEYLEKVINSIESHIISLSQQLGINRNELITARKDMWDNNSHALNDFNKVVEAIQNQMSLDSKTTSYNDKRNNINKLERMRKWPYFARIDFQEDGYEKESIYIGLGNLTDKKTFQAYVYDWRAPVSSMFYRFEPGLASYSAPIGEISGELTLKRQYEIKNGQLLYFFDCSLNITDDILKQVLSKNASEKMKNIVETIQREQDKIIRDAENEVLIVQGVAGSGKTSVAMHRIAYLLYQGLADRLSVNNILLISPNDLFSQYISNVLPELGEENIRKITFDELFKEICGDEIRVQSKNQSIETIIEASDDIKSLLREAESFKLSETFACILDKYLQHIEHKLIHFNDIYFDGNTIISSQYLKAMLLNNKIKNPLQKQLLKIEAFIEDKLHPLRIARTGKIESIIRNYSEHQFEVKPFSRLLSLKESKRFIENLKKITRLDYVALYKKLFRDKKLFYHLAKNYQLPANIDQIIDYTASMLESNFSYSDSIPLIYFRIRAEGCNSFNEIRQVVVDEAQDYSYMNYKILDLLFKNARYTITGDINQSINKINNMSIYSEITNILNKKKSSLLSMRKCYRSSFEITKFCNGIINDSNESEAFERFEASPEVIKYDNIEKLISNIIEKINLYKENGFNSVALICKTKKAADILEGKIKPHYELRCMSEYWNEELGGAFVIPVYLAKGLEFDAVIVIDADDNNYKDDYDKSLLYIACTRALHRLCLLYSGEISRLIQFL